MSESEESGEQQEEEEKKQLESVHFLFPNRRSFFTVV